MHYPVLITILFFLGSAIFASISLSNNKYIVQIIKTHWKWIIVILILNCLFKFPFNTPFFHGLEYEDAYVYKASARFIEYKKDYSVDPFLTTSCTFGSLKNCQFSGTYSGHVIGYPVIVSLLQYIVGDHPDIANYLSLFFSILSVLILFLVAQLIFNNKIYSALSCLIFISVPVFNIFSSSSVSEPTSNIYITLALLLYLAYMHYPNESHNYNLRSSILSWTALFFTSLIMVLIKRENYALILCLPIATLFYLILCRNNLDNKVKRSIKVNLIAYTTIIIIVSIFYFVIMGVMKGNTIEMIEINKATFSIDYFLELLPLFLKSFFHFEWYFLFSTFLLIGYCYSIKRSLAIFPIIIFSLYFLLYTSHYRHYVFVKGGAVTEFETLRYMTNLMSVYSLIAGSGIVAIYKIAEKLIPKINLFQSKAFVYICASIILGSCFILTLRLRHNFVEDEYFSRISPVIRTINFSKNKGNAYILTEESLLFQIYGNENLNLIDFSLISINIPKAKLDKLINQNYVVYLDKYNNGEAIWAQRFKEQFDYINSKRKLLIFDGKKENGNYKIYRIANNSKTSQ